MSHEVVAKMGVTQALIARRSLELTAQELEGAVKRAKPGTYRASEEAMALTDVKNMRDAAQALQAGVDRFYGRRRKSG